MGIEEIVDQKPESISEDLSVREAAEVMARLNLGAILVDRDDVIIGIVSERDLMKKVIAKNLSLTETKVKAIMTSPIITVTTEVTPTEALDLMFQKNIRHLPVRDHRDQIVAVLGIRDVMKHILNSIMKAVITY